jgi:three-Cys-motif partner protein
MSSITETLWPIEPHTAKKHEILKRYFQAWLPILGHSNNRLLYIDAFGGPGKYAGKPGKTGDRRDVPKNQGKTGGKPGTDGTFPRIKDSPIFVL